MALPAFWPASTSISAARQRAVAVFGADAGRFDADWPDPARAAEQPAQAFDRGEKVAAVLLHHRQQQVAAGVSAQARMLERREPRQQHAAGLAFVARQRQRALQHVARRQHAELVAAADRSCRRCRTS